MVKNQRHSKSIRAAPSWIRRLLPLAGAAVLIPLIFFALHTYRQSAQVLAQQHNLQHLHLIQTVTASLQNRFVNMEAAYSHYATLIDDSRNSELTAKQVTTEIERLFSTVVTSVFILRNRAGEDLWSQKRSKLELTPASSDLLDRTAADAEHHLLALHSTDRKGLLIFLTPLRQAGTHLAVVVPLEGLFATYHLNDTGYDDDYVWILDREGTLVYHRYHPEMIGNNVLNHDQSCSRCHQSFELEKKMIASWGGYGWNEVPQGRGKIVAYVPLNYLDLHWTIAVSEGIDKTTAILQHDVRVYTLIAIALSLLILGISVYITRSNHLRRHAEQEAFHLREERELQRQLHEAERFGTIGRMAAQVAHEIKNPLSSISLNTELLGDELGGSGQPTSLEAQRLIQSILSEIDLLSTTIEEYLRFSRFPKLQREPTSIQEVLQGLTHLLQEESALRDITLRFSADANVPPLSADPRLLRQALLNLLRNSLDAVGNRGWIRIEACKDDGNLRIEVSDSGPGVSPEHRVMLFEPFFTTKPKGTGMGLPLTRHIIYEHGGSISYQSTPEVAARFVISLPYETPQGKRGSTE